MLYEDSSIVFYLNDSKISEITSAYVGTIFELPLLTQEKNTLRIEGPFYGNVEFYLESFNKEAYLSAMEQLKTNKLENVQSKGNIITGTIDAGVGGTLFTTIPYDDGFSIYVDGIKTNYNKALETFISIELSAGPHDIKFVYTPPGLMVGIFIMCISLIGSAVFYKRKIK